MEKQPNSVTVTDPLIFYDANLPYVSYLVSGRDSKGPFSVRRRYRDFYLLREKIVERWPGLYVPPISSKKVAGNTEDKFVELRRKFLNYFSEKISQREYFLNSDVFQLFLRGAGQFDKSVKELDNIDYEALSVVYQKNFTELTQQSSEAELQLSCENDYDFLKNSEKKLERIRQDLRALSAAKVDYEKQFNFCMGSTLPEYQEKFLLKYVEEDRQKLFISNGQQFAEKLQQYGNYTADNALQDYCEIISYQLRQMRAFTEAIQSRKRSEQTKQKMQSQRRADKEQLQKLKAGKTTLKSFFSMGKKKEDQIKKIEDQIAKSQRDEEALTNMIFLMNAAICFQLSEYKKRRIAQYRNNVEIIHKKEMKQMNIFGSLIEIPIKDRIEQHQQNNNEQ